VTGASLSLHWEEAWEGFQNAYFGALFGHSDEHTINENFEEKKYFFTYPGGSV